MLYLFFEDGMRETADYLKHEINEFFKVFGISCKCEFFNPNPVLTKWASYPTNCDKAINFKLFGDMDEIRKFVDSANDLSSIQKAFLIKTDIFDPDVSDNMKGNFTIDSKPADIAWMFGVCFSKVKSLVVSDYRLENFSKESKLFYLYMLFLHEVGHMLLGTELPWHKDSYGYTPLIGSDQPAEDSFGKHCVSRECIMYPIIDIDKKSADATGSFVKFQNDPTEYRDATLVELVERLGNRKFCEKCFDTLRSYR
jgi:hypothetical protein